MASYDLVNICWEIIPKGDLFLWYQSKHSGSYWRHKFSFTRHIVSTVDSASSVSVFPKFDPLCITTSLYSGDKTMGILEDKCTLVGGQLFH